ncbi:PREDICTED: vicilin-like seed storage protein At3g22640 [Camelina sativa]|uniref:Vicilin-like seed storage protein At3g22640 n=1 Tax=Camelina sativa TaxID=90675 RepID=A0AA51RGW8_CAMSA|nr:PREDICTED: vicilin-like seed storage protein At3g22640 [Camelina sativa]UNP61734.1 vicilin Vic1B-1-G3 [Camelina sativa]WMQ52470.1 Vicillin [Camelina sativa]
MAMTKKLIITLLLLISIAFVHCLAFHVELEEFKPPQQEEQDVHGGGGSSKGWQEELSEFPYHFKKQSFKNWFQSKEGFVKMLPKFTKRAPNLFRGIENYRFSLYEMEPNTFLVPLHLDADSVVIILQGQGVAEFVTAKTKELFHLTKGDVVRLPSGITHFAINTNQTVPLRFAKITIPVNIPGQFQNYFSAPSQFQQSYFTGFSKEVLSASFNIPEELVGRIFFGSQQMGQGILRRITPEQIKEITENSTSRSNKDKDKSTKFSPFNLFTHDSVSSYTNDFGHFHEAQPDSFDQIQDLQIAVTWTNMTQGSVFLPQYNSKATFVTFVENGCARYEMASPYSFQREQQQQQWWPEQGGEEEEDMSGQVHKIVSRVCKGDVFIIPAGHPFTIVSHDENFVSVGFGIYASNSIRTFLAGQGNVLSNLDTVATRVAFGVRSKVAEKLFTSQNYSYFAPTTRSHQQT